MDNCKNILKIRVVLFEPPFECQLMRQP